MTTCNLNQEIPDQIYVERGIVGDYTIEEGFGCYMHGGIEFKNGKIKTHLEIVQYNDRTRIVNKII